jgi:tetratricopeptide (TPR) repeat protein
VRAYLQAGHTYRYWGKYAESEKMFLAAAALAPKDAWIYTELGKLYRNWNKDDEAEAALLKSVALDPTQENVYSYGLGYLYLQEKRYAESEAMFKKALSIDPRSDLALSGMGDLNRETGHYDVSESYFKKAFAVNPKSEAYLGLAWLYIKQNRFDDAVVPLRAFLANIREKGEVYYALGVAYTGKGDTADARTAFQKSVALNPDNQMFKDALARNESGK